jgi:hypothetical protein
MATSVTFFPVDCGDMTLISLGDKQETTILIDCNIRGAADDPEDKTRDVAKDLRERLKRDGKGRPYVDVYFLSHPDQDHCRGVQNHFYLGAPDEYPDDKKPDNKKKIFIKEIWSSPIVFRRASKNHTLCDDAKAFNSEAKRRVKVNLEAKFSGVVEGNRILVLGEDEDGKTDDLGPILVKIDETFSKVNGSESKVFKANLLAPLSKSDSDEEEEKLRKNHSSVILNIELAGDDARKAVKNFLTGGDAEVAIWERLWEKHEKTPSVLEYDLMQTPHHCSWHSLSYDSWSEKHEKAEVSKSARSALSQIRNAGVIVASSAPIEDDDIDPPCHGAKLEYQKIVKNAKGKFYCTGEYPTCGSPGPLELTIAENKVEESVRKVQLGAPAIVTSGMIDAIGARAAERSPVKKEGNGRYA